MTKFIIGVLAAGSIIAIINQILKFILIKVNNIWDKFPKWSQMLMLYGIAIIIALIMANIGFFAPYVFADKFFFVLISVSMSNAIYDFVKNLIANFIQWLTFIIKK